MKNYRKSRNLMFLFGMRATTLVAAMALVLGGLFRASDVLAVTLSPSVVASIHDEPLDGVGDSFNVEPFEGLLRQQSYREDRAILEFDLGSFVGQSLEQAMLDFEIHVNNAGGSQFREFDLFVYSGNGMADLFDFAIAGTLVATVGYSVPDHYGTFNLDILGTAQEILDGGGSFVGVRVDPIGSDNFPSILSNSSFTVVPEPATVCLLGLGTLALLRKRNG